MGSLSIYLTLIFKCPETALKNLESLCVRYFWGGSTSNKKMAWIKCESVLDTFNKGVLNIGSLKAFNIALVSKWLWCYLNCPDDVKVKVIKSIHGDIFDQTYGNSTWSAIVETRRKAISNNLLPSNLNQMDVGNGRNISVWLDVWSGGPPLVNRL
ncbi:uncharacterized protein [Rutidosis leptorrhynchoides]|uniref:uncharacterized protein n=1 Tax=Rutidosis leptorrhynchoides TaxID=125765 RepID=UPI003A98DDB7